MLKAAPQWIHHGCLTDLTRLETVVTQTYRRETARDLILLVAWGGVKDCLVCFGVFVRVACRPGPLRAVRSLRDLCTPLGGAPIGREVKNVDLAVVVEMAAGLG